MAQFKDKLDQTAAEAAAQAELVKKEAEAKAAVVAKEFEVFAASAKQDNEALLLELGDV